MYGRRKINPRVTYRRIFCSDYNLSFYKPKKDQCQSCIAYETRNAEKTAEIEENYAAHLRRMDDCNAAKIRDKERAVEDDKFVSVTFDLQSVFQIPSSDVSPMYYSRKNCVYNLTIYEAAPPNAAFCFSWTEMNGKRGSSEIGTCLMHYLTNRPQQVTEVSLFSDTCGGQNRNQHIATLFMHLVQTTHLEVIEHKFLESGHSYMEVDSMHSAIEKAKKFVPVFTMQDWLTIFRLARSKGLKGKSPYEVKEMKFKDFVDLKQLSKDKIKNKNRDINGEHVNWLLVKCFKYCKASPGIIYYRYDHTSEYTSLPVTGKGRPRLVTELPKMYSNPLPISDLKKRDLLKLCRTGVIPDEFHGWYRDLPTSEEVTDCVPQPATEDTGSDDSDE